LIKVKYGAVATVAVAALLGDASGTHAWSKDGHTIVVGAASLMQSFGDVKHCAPDGDDVYCFSNKNGPVVKLRWIPDVAREGTPELVGTLCGASGMPSTSTGSLRGFDGPDLKGSLLTCNAPFADFDFLARTNKLAEQISVTSIQKDKVIACEITGSSMTVSSVPVKMPAKKLAMLATFTTDHASHYNGKKWTEYASTAGSNNQLNFYREEADDIPNGLYSAPELLLGKGDVRYLIKKGPAVITFAGTCSYVTTEKFNALVSKYVK
jgi:hypothetical protein